MRHFSFLLVLAFVFASSASAQDRYVKSGNDRFSIKAQTYIGYYAMPSGNMEDIDPSAPNGLNFGIEFPSSQQRPWQQYLNNPTVGLGLSYIDFGDAIMGKGIAMYPYIMLNAYRHEYFHLKVKLGAGLAGLNEIYKTTLNEVYPNKTFSSFLNAYLTGGLNLEFPVTRNLKINSEFGFFHISNGRTVEPNKGANVLYGGVGLVATINPEEKDEKEPMTFPDLPYGWTLNFTASAGAHAADVEDGRRFLIMSAHAGAVYSVCNWYAVGPGMDLFYNDAIGNVTNRGMYKRTENKWKRMRGGLSLNNEFKFGDVTALVGMGLYLYNPVRHLYTNENPLYVGVRRPLFYKTDGAGSEEACHYIRFGLRYRVYDTFYLQALAKTHFHICELVEFGIGYQSPFFKKGKGCGDSKIFHNSRDWWQNY